MGSTTNGLPYPEPTDDLRNGAAAIQSLAVDLDVQGTIGTLVNIPTTGGTLTAQRVGGVVVISGYVTGGSWPTNATTDFVAVGGIPAALCPVGNAFALGYFNGPVGVAFARANGSMGVRNDSGATRSSLQFTLIYPINSIVATSGAPKS